MTRSYTERLLAGAAPRPSRFRFTARRCRRRCARALAAGHDLAAVARIERVPAIELEALLADAQFQALVEHYAAIAALPRPERLARLADVALEVLELAVEAGELRASMFVLHEQRAGRDPSRTVAEAALARIEADQARTLASATAAAPMASSSPKGGRPGEPMASSSPEGGRPGEPMASGSPEGGRPGEPTASRDAAWTHCAMAHGHVMDAELRAVRDLRDVAAGLRRSLARLADRLANEAERAGTGLADSQAVAHELTARGVARFHHGRARSVDALIRLDRRQREAAFGRADPAVGATVPDLPPPGPVALDRLVPADRSGAPSESAPQSDHDGGLSTIHPSPGRPEVPAPDMPDPDDPGGGPQFAACDDPPGPAEPTCRSGPSLEAPTPPSPPPPSPRTDNGGAERDGRLDPRARGP